MMKCPKCGYERQPRDNQYVPVTECPACGIVYAKSEAISDFSPRKPSGSSSKKPSPVDEESLRKARERVDMRLRKQLEARVYDEKHAQTLERARLLTSQAVAMRRADRKSEMDAAETLKTVSYDTLSPDPPKGTDSEPVLDLVAIANQKRQTMASPDHRLDQAPEEGEAAAASESTGSLLFPIDGVPEPEEKSPATEEMAAHPATEPQNEKKQLDEPAPEGALRSEAQQTEDETEESAYTLDSRRDDEPVAPLEAPSRQADDYHAQPLKVGGGLPRLMSVAAWIILLAGAIGTILSWTTLGNVRADMGVAPIAQSHFMPVGLLLGFAYLATGVLGFAFFWVSSLINRQLKDIRQILLNLPLSLPQGEDENAPWVDRGDEVKE